MAKEQIKVTCEGADSVGVTNLIHFQGNLKSLANQDYKKLKGQILKLGFSEPVGVWQHKGKYYILSGHQRVRTILRMVEEGYTAPDIPVNWIKAKDKNEAKRKVLSLTGQYGKLDKDGLYEFLNSSDIGAEELFDSYRFPEIDIPKFTEEYFVGDKGDDLDMGGLGLEEPTPDQVNDLSEAPGKTAHVKMVQLFFNEETHPRFMEMCAAIAEKCETENITDTVLAAVEKAHDAAMHEPPF